MAEERQWKYPVGTRRERTDGWYVKTHDNGPMDSIHAPWIKEPKIPEVFKRAFKDCDKIAREIFNAKNPIEGELWLDKEMDEFITSSGKVFKASQFKQYMSHVKGTFGYDFVSELTKRYIADTCKQNEVIAEELEAANESKRQKILNEGHPADKMCLTEDEIKEIKDRVRRDVRADDSEKLNLKDVEEILGCLTNVNEHLKKGVDFEDEEEKKTYKEAIEFKDNVLQGRNYTSIEEIKEKVKFHLLEMNRVFKDNWGVTASYEKQVTSLLDDYIKKFLPQIQKEEEESFNNKYKINLTNPNVNEFYEELKSKVFEGDIPTAEFMVGHTICSLDKYETKYKDYEVLRVSRIDREDDEPVRYDVIIKNSITGEEDMFTHVTRDRLQECFINKNFDSISVPMKVRFRRLYNKTVEGDWNINDTTTLETLEHLHQYLPKGHLLDNYELNSFKKDTQLVNSDNSYAHYNESYNQIFLSNEALSHAEKGITDIHSGSQIASVLVHEIGHAVAKKIGHRDSMPFRKFVKACGWSWEQFQGDASNLWRTTGESREMKRHGSFKDTPILTDYAATSPNEAFAEYYSIYSQYKKEIDSLLSGDSSKIEKVTKTKRENTKQKYGDFKGRVDTKAHEHQVLVGESYSSDTIDNIFQQNNRNIDDVIKTDVIDSFDETIQNLKQRDMNPYRTIQHKSPKSYTSDNYQSPNPVFTIFDPFTGKHNIVKTKKAIEGENVTNKVVIDGFHHFIDSKQFPDLKPGDTVLYEHDGEKFKGKLRQNRDHHTNKDLLPINKTQVKAFETEEIPTEGDIHFANKYLRRDTPLYSITQEGYNLLSNAGYTKTQIQSYVLEKVANKSIPKVKYNDDGSQDTYKGLQYAGEVIPAKKIEKNSHVFKVMKEIWESEELAKALIELGILSKAEDFNDIEITDSLLNDIEKSKDSKGKKKIYGDCIVYDITNPSKILLLLRNYQDEIIAGKWCLPGGHVEEGEDSETGALRELEEETGLEPMTYSKLGEIKANGCQITYMLVGVNPISNILLDNDEHYNYSWVDIKDLSDYEMIFDSKENVLKLLSIKENTIKTDLIKQIESRFNKGEITLEEYHKMKHNVDIC